MKPESIIVARPSVDFPNFLGIAMKVLGYSPATAGDVSGRRLTDAGRFLGCLASMRDSKAKYDLNVKLLSHASYSVLLVADEDDILDILECAAGMSFVTTETLVRGVLMVVISGTLAQWKNAVLAGASSDTAVTVRAAFNGIQGHFKDEGIDLWSDYKSRQAPDQITYLLEDKRAR